MKYTVTPSLLSLYKDCPRCFWQHYRGKKRPEGIYPSITYGIQKVLQQRADWFREKGVLPRELKSVHNAKLFDHALMALWRNGKKGLQWKSPEGHRLIGAVDDVLQRGEKLMVLEYVTRGFATKKETPAYYQDKLDLYTFLLQKNGFETDNFACIVFYFPKGMNSGGDIWFQKELKWRKVSVQNAERLFYKAISVLEGKMPKASSGCGFCKWKEVK